MTTVDAKTNQATILVVDDNPTNLRVVVGFLANYDFEIMTSLDGEDAIRKATRFMPDIILLDVMMPGIDGFETCRRLTANPTTKNIPVIFMTALSSEDDKVRGFEAGAVDYITKPIQQRELLARMTTHLQIQAQAQQLRAQREQLIALNASKDKFFSIIAHDLKGPFLPLLGNLELLAEMADTLSPQDVRAMSSSSHRSAKLVFDLLESLLVWSRIQMGHMDYQPEPLNLHEIVQQTTSVLNNVAKSKNITLTNTVATGLAVYTDPNMLDMVVRNLTNNALKFTRPQGRVTIMAQKMDEDWVTVSVQDTGIGMTEVVKQKIFQPDQHVTTAGTNKEKGSGLGLIMCQEIVQMYGGTIWAESELDVGTTVNFTVPIKESSSLVLSQVEIDG